MPLEAQAKLLRVLEDGQVDRVGSSQSNRVDVRIIAATNADLVAAIGTGKFRPDLYYRLHVFPIVIPPLRDRPEDIPLLARHFLKYFQSKFKRPGLEFGAQVMDRLVRYPWPGNVRELQNMIERAVILARSSTVEIDDQLLMPPSALAKADGRISSKSWSDCISFRYSIVPCGGSMDRMVPPRSLASIQAPCAADSNGLV